MVVVLRKSNLQLQNFFHYNANMLVVSFDFVPMTGYPLRVGELVLDAPCAIALLEP